MASNVPKKGNRTMALDALQKLAEGYIKHAAALPQIVVAGSSMTAAEVASKVQARISVAKAVQSAHAIWQNAVKADGDADEQYNTFLSGIRQTAMAAFAGQVDVLADYGLSPRKVAVVSPETKSAAALKAKATRLARGTMGKKQRAKIKPSVTVTPAVAVVNEPAAPEKPAGPGS